MSFNGSGTFNINTAGQPVVTGTVITSSAFNALTADLATGLSTCITKDGQTTVTANIPMNSFKFTGLAAGTAATDSVRLSQLQAGGATLVTVTGTNTYAGTMSPALAAYAAGNTFTFLVPNTNTTSCTLNIDGLGAKAITRDGTTALVAGDLVANSEVAVVYDGTQFQVLNSNSKTNFNLSGNFTIAGSVTPSGGTANGVAYLNGSKVLTTGSALTYNGTGLGIGIASAIGNLDVYTLATSVGYVRTANQTLKFTADDAGNRVDIANVAGNPMSFTIGVTEQMRLTSTGLGIGTSSPGTKLDVNGTARIRAGNTFYFQNAAADANATISASGGSGSSDMAINASGGNVGIGTSSPSVRLDVQGGSINTSSFVTITPTTGTSNAIYRATNTGGTFYAGLDNSAGGVTGTAYSGLLWHTGAYPIAFGTSGTERMRIAAAGNVTINAPSSGESLTVNTISGSGIRATAADLPRVATVSTGANAVTVSMRSYDAGAFGIVGTQSNHALNLRTNDLDRLVIDTSGNVGIGTTSPSYKLDTNSSSAGTIARFVNGVGRGYVRMDGYDDMTLQFYRRGAATGFIQTDSSGAEFIAGTAGAYPFSFYTNNTERMRIDSSGNLGLGVTPSAWGGSFKALQFPVGAIGSIDAGAGNRQLNVFNNAYYDGANFKYVATDTAQAYRLISGEHRWYNAPSGTAGTAITFTQAMTLDASGNLLVGTTSVFSSSKLTVQGNATYAAAILGTAGNTTSNALFIGLGGNRSTDTTYSVINYVDTDGTGTARFRVYGNGNVVNTNNSYGAISDANLKENIVDATPKLASLMQVRIRNFNMKSAPSQKQIGVVAQELEQVFPGMVDESPDRDMDGNDLGTTTKSVKYSVFVPMLIKAMQEQQALIDQLTTRLTALENK